MMSILQNELIELEKRLMYSLINIDRLNKLDILKRLNEFLFVFFRIKLIFYRKKDKLEKIEDYCKDDEICQLVCKSEVKSRCKKSLSRDIRRALDKKKIVIHDCFLKTQRLIVPIMINRNVYGLALSTQFKSKSSKPVLREIFKKNKDLMGAVDSKLGNILIVDKNKFKALVDFLRSFTNYVFVSRFEEIAFLKSQMSKSHLQGAVAKAADYISQNYYRPNLSLGEVSEAVNLSPYYFSHQFKKEYDTTFIDYLTKVRLGASAKLLKDLRLSIAQISFAAGYQDPNYFSKVFKKYIRISPAEYREQVTFQKTI